MIFLIILAIFFVPMASIITIKGTIVWYPQLLMLQLFGGIAFSSIFWRLNKFLAIFLAYLSFSYVYVTSANPRTLLCLGIGYMTISITLCISKIKNLKWIYIALTAMSVISAVYCVLQSFGIDPVFISMGEKFAGIVSFMGSHDQLGAYSCANAFWFPFLTPLAIVPIFLSKCNSAFIGLIAGSLLYISFRYGKKFVGIFLIALAIIIIPWLHFCSKSHQEINERINLWKLSIQQIKSGTIHESYFDGKTVTVSANPWLGFGLGNFFRMSPMSQYKMYGLTHTRTDGIIEHQFYEHAHNDLVEALYEFGYVGFAIIICIIISLVVAFICSNKTSGVILTFSSLLAQGISSCGIYIFHAPVSLFMICLTIGLFYGEINNAKSS